MSKSKKKPVVRAKGWVPLRDSGYVPEVWVRDVAFVKLDGAWRCFSTRAAIERAFAPLSRDLRPATPAELSQFLREIEAAKKKQAETPKPSAEEVSAKLLDACKASLIFIDLNISVPPESNILEILRDAIAFAKRGGVE